MVKPWKKIAVTMCAAALLTGSLAGCGGNQTASIDPDNPKVTVMTKSFNADPAPADSPVMLELEKYLGCDLDITWVPSSSYDEKVTAAMGAGEYPMAMLVGSQSSSVIQNSRGGTFWEITDKFNDSAKFPNLSQANPTINHNISIDGKVYGVYRGRTLGRSGISIRKDWLKNVNMEMPETVDDLYQVLKAFKEKDPDQNGQDDTFGMIVTNYSGPLDNLIVWMGAPNKWGLNEQTKELEPSFMFDEYFDALNFMKKCYDEKLINQDMATYDSTKWDEQFLSSKAGVIIDVADRARRLSQNIASINPKAEVDVIGYVKKDASSEGRVLPTTGYDGYYVFPKQAVHTEADLDFVLGVLDKANDQEAQNLTSYGIEGRNYEINEEGYAVKSTDAAMTKEYADLNQFIPGIVTQQLKLQYTTDVAKTVEEVYLDNEKYAVANPAEPYVSDTYSTKGPQLDAIIAEANTKYIVGQISADDWKKEVERWKSNGGTKVIEEINKAYQADESVKKAK